MSDRKDGEGPEKSSGRGLGATAARGAAITIAAQGARIMIQVVSVVVLVRLLSATDYGLLAMVLAIIGVGEIFRDFGLSSAAIQSTHLSKPQRDNLFWLNTAIGIVLAGIVYFSAGLLAGLFNRDELVGIAHALSAVFLLNGLATQYRADLIRRLRFMSLARADVLAPVLALTVAIGGAFSGWGYWALVAQQLVQAAVLLIVLAISARWMPGLPRRHVPMAGFIRFGWHLVATQLVGYISNNVDTVLIGVRFGAAPLGIYNRGFQLLMTPLNQIRTPLTTVALPVLSKLKDESKRFNEFVTRGQLALGYSVVAGLGIVASCADPLTSVVLGDEWSEVAPILRFLAIAGAFQTLAFVGYWVYVSRGLTAALFRYSLLSAAIKITCVVIGSLGGIVGIAAGYAVAPAISWPISIWLLSRKTPLPTRKLYGGAFRVLGFVIAGAAASVTATSLLPTPSAAVELLVGVVASVGVYLIAIAVIRPIRRDVFEIISLVRFIPLSRRS